MAEHAGFEVRDVENLREHYALTLRQWVNRLEARHDDAVRIADETLYRTWRLYMAGAVYGFETGGININQTLIARPDRGAVPLPRSCADLYTAPERLTLCGGVREVTFDGATSGTDTRFIIRNHIGQPFGLPAGLR